MENDIRYALVLVLVPDTDEAMEFLALETDGMQPVVTDLNHEDAEERFIFISDNIGSNQPLRDL